MPNHSETLVARCTTTSKPSENSEIVLAHGWPNPELRIPRFSSHYLGMPDGHCGACPNMG
eukprot:6188179-Lingulodinium_polyedra.AAC.1